MNEPTINEMRLAICEWMGWKWYKFPYSGSSGLEFYQIISPHQDIEWIERQKGTKSIRPSSWLCEIQGNIPNLTLDWLHECEKRLNNVQQRKYAMLVHEITKAGDTFGRGHNYFTILHATAEQRLTALYRTIKQ